MKQGIHSHFPFPLCYHWSQDDVFAKYGKTEKKKKRYDLGNQTAVEVFKQFAAQEWSHYYYREH